MRTTGNTTRGCERGAGRWPALRALAQPLAGTLTRRHIVARVKGRGWRTRPSGRGTRASAARSPSQGPGTRTCMVAVVSAWRWQRRQRVYARACVFIGGLTGGRFGCSCRLGETVPRIILLFMNTGGRRRVGVAGSQGPPTCSGFSVSQRAVAPTRGPCMVARHTAGYGEGVTKKDAKSDKTASRMTHAPGRNLAIGAHYSARSAPGLGDHTRTQHQRPSATLLDPDKATRYPAQHSAHVAWQTAARIELQLVGRRLWFSVRPGKGIRSPRARPVPLRRRSRSSR